ncbi:MAG: response regulator [Deltaproteobacteria bacterium]|nr:response regulator [Deltaproteobacteria bacterium]
MTDKKKILVIDDDQRICSLLKLKLEKNGNNKVIFSLEGMQGFVLAKKEKPDLIILDLVMDGIPGNEVAHILSLESLTKDIPVVFLSSLITEEEVPAEGAFVSERYLIPKTSNVNGVINGIENYIAKYL